ncbi:MAG: nitroreductase family deazaflavin-dependent oxidoreductase [Actinomycetota bacterium]
MEVKDSATGWVAKHTREYVESDGKRGHKWHGVRCLVLTTTGRRSGDRRRTALIYGTDADDYVVVASRGGNENHPQWYLNLVADPNVHVQVGAEKFDARARVASPKDRQRLWPVMVKIWPDYERYQATTDREIPVVVLERS